MTATRNWAINFLLLLCASSGFASLQCSLPNPDIPDSWIDMVPKCVDVVRNQIEKEVNASYTYMAMAAHFAKDTVNRPGFAKLFFNSAREERQHAKKLIDYLTMRGRLTDSVSNLITIPQIEKSTWQTGTEALEDALNLEAQVTLSIRGVMKTCEKGINDYHFVDFLTNDYLDEQYHGQRDLAGKLATLKKMTRNNGDLEEFLFDKELLK